MLFCCGCDYSSSNSGNAGSTVTTTQTEAPKEVRCKITVEYDETLSEHIFGNNEVFFISLDGEEIGSVSSSYDSQTIVKELYLTEGKHKVSAESSKEKLFDYNTVYFDVKDTDGLYTAELKVDKGDLVLVKTHIYDTNKNEPQEEEETTSISINEDDYVYLNVYVCNDLSMIPDIFTHDFQAFTIYLDGEEIGTLDHDSPAIDQNFYFAKGAHKISIRKNNTDDYDYDSVTFNVNNRTQDLSFLISHNQLLDTYKLEVRE